MSEHLFIGGFSDGKRIETPPDAPIIKMQSLQSPFASRVGFTPTEQTYCLMPLTDDVSVYALSSLNLSRVAALLVQHYKRP